MTDFINWILTTDHLHDFSILMLCFCVVTSYRETRRCKQHVEQLLHEVGRLNQSVAFLSSYVGEMVAQRYISLDSQCNASVQTDKLRPEESEERST